jgi:hypothetical protein
VKCVKKLKNTLSIAKYWINTDVKYKMKKFDKILFQKFRSNTKIARKVPILVIRTMSLRYILYQT